MDLFIGERRTGKTHKLMTEYFMDSDITLLVFCEAERTRLIKEYRLNKSQSDRIISWENCKEKIQGTSRPVAIDNLDIIISNYLNRTPVAVTMTGWEDSDGKD